MNDLIPLGNPVRPTSFCKAFDRIKLKDLVSLISDSNKFFACSVRDFSTSCYYCECKGHIVSTIITILALCIQSLLINKFTFFFFAVPMWAVAAIVVVVLVLVGCFIFCVFKKCFGKKKKPKKVRERKTGRRKKEKEGEGEAGEKVCHYQLPLIL